MASQQVSVCRASTENGGDWRRLCRWRCAAGGLRCAAGDSPGCVGAHTQTRESVLSRNDGPWGCGRPQGQANWKQGATCRLIHGTAPGAATPDAVPPLAAFRFAPHGYANSSKPATWGAKHVGWRVATGGATCTFMEPDIAGAG